MLLTSVSIDLADPNVRSTASMLALLWGVGVAAVLYSIFADISEWRRSRKPRTERRFIEPCAEGMHEPDLAGTTCVTCKQTIEPQPNP